MMATAKDQSRRRRSKNKGPNRLERFMFWTLVPATVLLPAWLVVGRSLMGGPKGWGSIVLILTWGPILFLYHILLLTIYIVKNHRRKNKHQQRSSSTKIPKTYTKYNTKHFVSSVLHSSKEYFITEQSAIILGLYYCVSLVVQLFMKDGDADQGSMASIATTLLGIRDELSSEIGWALFFASIALALELLFLAIVEPLPGEPRKLCASSRKVKRQ